MTMLELDDTEVIQKRYKLRRMSNKCIETTIPFEVFAREARRAGLTPEQALKQLEAVWRYNSFHGLHLSFEEKEKFEV